MSISKTAAACKRNLFFILVIAFLPVRAQQLAWPILKHYEKENLTRISMPVGGIGTGDICIAGNGQWKDVEIMNKPGIGFNGAVSPKLAPCFLIFTDDHAGSKKTKMLAGETPLSEYDGMQGSTSANNGFPRFQNASFEVAYPFAAVGLEDEEMPVSVKLKTFNPFVPANADWSGIPVAIIRYEIKNKTQKRLTVAVAGSMDNFIGMDGSKQRLDGFDNSYYPTGSKNNRNVFKETKDLAGIYMSSDSVDHDASAWGTIALTTSNISKDFAISYRTELNPAGWNSDINDLWDDFADDGSFHDTVFSSKQDIPHAALSLRFDLDPMETKEVQFLITWDFPNRKDWNDKETIGNYYSTFYGDAWDVAEKTIPKLPMLEQRSLDFVNLFLQSDYPAAIKEAALFNTSTLRSQTVFRSRDGNFFGWEGVFNSTGSCYGNCEHVWNYELATPFLFGTLAKKMRELEYKYSLDDSSGLMSFRISLPLNKTSNWKVAAADGQMGTIIKTYREWQLSGDDDFLKQNWPAIKKTIAFAWIKGGWDANQDGLMEGCQHNTMDIEYLGPNPEIEFWYLGALKAATKMAEYMKDDDFAKRCRNLFQRGSLLTDKELFNGEYYIQKIEPLVKKDIATGLIAGMGTRDFNDPDFQIGEGCLVDQLVGQNLAFVAGLGLLADSSHLKKTMVSINRYNHVNSFNSQFNNMRTYGLGNESGLILTAYPDPAKRPRIPLSYASEAWTGLEYTAAALMIYQGMNDEALKVITDVRNRYDGIKRNPFNEQECGNHYARAMASWGTVIAWSRFNYSAVDKRFTITDTPGKYFWSNGYAWGMAEVKSDHKVNISVHYGELKLMSVELKNSRLVELQKPEVLKEGDSKVF
jgi:non-lysosomal glucosylceramidase